MKFNVFGIKIHISFLFCVFLAIILIQDKTLVALPLISAVITHELAHLVCMVLLGVSPKEINLTPQGIEIIGTKTKKINQEIIIAVAGPAINIIISVIMFLYYLTYMQQNELIWTLVWAFIGLFNLLPAKGLDGGTILFYMCLKKLSVPKSELILKLSSLIIAVCLLVTGIYFIFISFNPSVLIMGLYLLVLILIKN